MNPYALLAWAAVLLESFALAVWALVTAVEGVPLGGVHGELYYVAPWVRGVSLILAVAMPVTVIVCRYYNRRQQRRTLWCNASLPASVALWIAALALQLAILLMPTTFLRPLASTRAGSSRYFLLCDNAHTIRARHYVLAREVSADPTHIRLQLLGELPGHRDDLLGRGILAWRMRLALKSPSIEMREAARVLMPQAERFQRLLKSDESWRLDLHDSPYDP